MGNYVACFLGIAICYLIFQQFYIWYSGNKEEIQKNVYLLTILDGKKVEFMDFCSLKKIPCMKAVNENQIKVIVTEKQADECLTHHAVKEERHVEKF